MMIRSSSLPGGIAGASLKPLLAEQQRAEWRTALPGGIAGASLKRRTASVRIAARARSPRRNRRGLIEACAREGPRGAIRALPGGIAGASLKQVQLFQLLLRVLPLPGGIAGASLKPAPVKGVEMDAAELSPAE